MTWLSIGTSIDSGGFKMIYNHYNLANQTDGVWISGTDLLVDGEWIWAKTGQPIDYFRWGPGEPNSVHMKMGGEDCIDLIRHKDFMWNDEPCEYRMNFVCERP